MKGPLLTGEGCVLRPLDLSDAPALFEADSDPTVRHFWSAPAHDDIGKTEAAIARMLADEACLIWAISADGDRAEGRIALFTLRDGVAEIGIILRARAQGRGLGRRALALVARHGFSDLGLHRMFGDVDPENVACLKMFAAAGFAREALLRGNWRTHLGVRDSVIMARLRDDVM